MAVVSLGVHPTHYSLKENVKKVAVRFSCDVFPISCQLHSLAQGYIYNAFSGYCLYVYRGDSLTLSKCIHILAWRFAN